MCCRSEEGSVRQSTFRYRVDPTNTSGVVFLVRHDNDDDDSDNDDNDDDDNDNDDNDGDDAKYYENFLHSDEIARRM